MTISTVSRNNVSAVGRDVDVEYIQGCVARGHCCAISGVSNLGKSKLLRMVCETGNRVESQHLWVYVDCNLALERTPQGLYEIALRALIEMVASQSPDAPWLAPVQRAYETLVTPTSHFQDMHSFVEGLRAVIEIGDRRLVLAFDEMDALFAAVDGQVLLNLRALKDRYGPALCYVVATDRPLDEIRSDGDAGEFIELFAHCTRQLAPLDAAGTRAFARQWAAQNGVTFDDEDLAFLRDQADGHPGLLVAACAVLGRVTGAPERSPSQNQLIHRRVETLLATDEVVQAECAKLWRDLSQDEQAAFLAILTPEPDPNPAALESLRRKYLARDGKHGPEPFCRLFANYIYRQRVARQPLRAGIRVDVQAGDVWVDGTRLPPLTDLEYRLLLLLYGRLNQIVDKYQIVQAVWGEDYIDEVDDARIERLVGRLREKVEPDPRRPRYIVTVRGRGYRLVGG